MTAKTMTCEECGGPVSGCGYVSRATCSPKCYRVRSERERREHHRRTVISSWRFWNKDRATGDGFVAIYLEDARGRFRAWWKYPYLADLAREYRVYERLAAMKNRSGAETDGRREMEATIQEAFFGDREGSGQ